MVKFLLGERGEIRATVWACKADGVAAILFDLGIFEFENGD
jgi:hypothetical protein